MTWYYRKEGNDTTGFKHYALGSSAVDKLVYNLAAVVSGIGPLGFTKKLKRKTGGDHYCLSARDDKRVLELGHLGV
jgi:hypothetical protein